MEATIAYWGSIGLMENDMGTTGVIGVMLERHFGLKGLQGCTQSPSPGQGTDTNFARPWKPCLGFRV